MYQINPTTNEIIPLPPKRFAELGYKEREHLQEWIAKCPEALGEELLIIQKEFDGFDETRERLDLLALDKDGGLVLIENKLDDSGRDVVWQALKYAAYCSSLNNEGIVRIYQEYLDKYEGGGSARDKIEDFLGKQEFDELVLNPGNDQRVMLVAANFRKEVTCTALWLLQHGIRVQCFKATAYGHAGQTFLNLEQIIPPPEAADFIITVAEKEKKQNEVQKTQHKRETLRREFWTQTLAALEQAGIRLYSNVSPGDDHWLSTGAGLSGVPYMMIFSQRDIRVELYIGKPSRDENKWIFDELFKEKEAIEAIFGRPIDWRRIEGKKACRIACCQNFDSFDRENWPEMIQWMTAYVPKLEKAFGPLISKISARMRNTPFGVEGGAQFQAGNPTGSVSESPDTP
jgi:hypothetical protein